MGLEVTVDGARPLAEALAAVGDVSIVMIDGALVMPGAAPGITSAPSIMTIETSASDASASPSGRALSTVSSRPMVISAASGARHPSG